MNTPQSLGWAWHKYSVSLSDCHHPDDQVLEVVEDGIPSGPELSHSPPPSPAQGEMVQLASPRPSGFAFFLEELMTCVSLEANVPLADTGYDATHATPASLRACS